MSRHSNDLRKRVIAFLKKGNTKAEAIRVFQVYRKTIDRWLELDKQGKLFEIKKYRHGFKSKIDLQKLLAFVDEHEDLYYSEIGKEFGISGTHAWRLLKAAKYSNKKNKQRIEK